MSVCVCRYDLDIAYDDTDGQFILGGVDPALGSFRGYLGQVKLYRGRALTLDEVLIGCGHAQHAFIHFFDRT